MQHSSNYTGNNKLGLCNFFDDEQTKYTQIYVICFRNKILAKKNLLEGK